MMSNSACLNGGATLFLTTFTRTRLPYASAPSLSVSMRRMSSLHRGVELQRPATRRRLGRAEHDADLLAQLVREEADRVGAIERAGQLAQRLTHQARLETDVAVAHLALDLGLGRERRDGVDRDDVDRARADEQLADLERLLARIRLRDEEIVDVDADPPRVLRIHRMLGVDERADAATPLCLGDDVVDERRLPRRLGAEDLDDAATRQASDPECHVERERTGRHRPDRNLGLVAHAHDRALSELSLDLAERDVERFLAIHLVIPPRRSAGFVPVGKHVRRT